MLSVPREKWDEVNCGELEPLIPGARDPAKTDIKEIRMNRHRKYCNIILWTTALFGALVRGFPDLGLLSFNMNILPFGVARMRGFESLHSSARLWTFLQRIRDEVEAEARASQASGSMRLVDMKKQK